MAGAVCFTCNKGNAIKIANMGRDMPPTFLRARTEALQTARPLWGLGLCGLRGRTDFFRLYYSGY